MQYVYVIGDYDEYGTENTLATLDRGKIANLLQESLDTTYASLDEDYRRAGKGPHLARKNTAADSLTELLKTPDEELAKNFGRNPIETDGWGGYLLYVLPLR